MNFDEMIRERPALWCLLRDEHLWAPTWPGTWDGGRYCLFCGTRD